MAFKPSVCTCSKANIVPNLISNPGSRSAGHWTKLPAPWGCLALVWGYRSQVRGRVYRVLLRGRLEKEKLKEKPLEPPAPWNLVEAPAGSPEKWYYWNQETGETSWNLPNQANEDSELSGRWRAVSRPEDGSVYYYNEVTMETSWTLPQDAVLLSDEEEDVPEEVEEDIIDQEALQEDEAVEEPEEKEEEEKIDEELEASEASPSTGSRASKASKASKASEEMDYSNLKVTELKELLSSRGLKVGGRKAELIARLEESESEEPVARPPSVSKRKTTSAQIKDKKRTRSTSTPETAQFLEKELDVDGVLKLPKEASIEKVKANLTFLTEELMPSKEFWAEAALKNSALFVADVDEMARTLSWLEEFLWNQEWAVGFGRQALAERIRHRPDLLLQGVEELANTVAWLEDRGLEDEKVRSYVAGPTAVPYPCEPYPWFELLQLGTQCLQKAENFLMKKRHWTKEQVSQALCQEPYILLAAATATGASPEPYPDYPLKEPRDSWLETHAEAASQ